MKKLRDNRGATLLMALLLLLAASVVSVVILSAATTAARRLESDRNSQQAYLTVSSAAELVRDDILASMFRQTVEDTYVDGSLIESKIVSTNSIVPEGCMSQWLTAGKEKADKGQTFEETIVLSLDTVDGLSDVTAKFLMGADRDHPYDITVYLSLADGGDDDCRLVLTLTGAPDTKTDNASGSGSTMTVWTTTSLSWPKAYIGKGAAE